MPKRQAISKKIRFEIFKRDSFKCQYCGMSAPDVVLHIDHINPVSKGGTNDTLNLITSCAECNSGKSNRKLEDKETLAKQKKQLDELGERREQLKMLLSWKNELLNTVNEELDGACDFWKQRATGWEINDTGRQRMANLIKKYGVSPVLNAMEESLSSKMDVDSKGVFTRESVEKAFDRIGGILRIKNIPQEKQNAYYIRGILRNRIPMDALDQHQIIPFIEDAINNGVTFEELKSISKNSDSITDFCNSINGLFDADQTS